MVPILGEDVAFEVFVEAPEVARWDEVAEASPEGEQAVEYLLNLMKCTPAATSFPD